MKYAIYTINTGDQYDLDIKMQYVEAVGLEALADVLPIDAMDIYVTDCKPVAYTIGKRLKAVV